MRPPSSALPVMCPTPPICCCWCSSLLPRFGRLGGGAQRQVASGCGVQQWVLSSGVDMCGLRAAYVPSNSRSMGRDGMRWCVYGDMRRWWKLWRSRDVKNSQQGYHLTIEIHDQYVGLPVISCHGRWRRSKRQCMVAVFDIYYCAVNFHNLTNWWRNLWCILLTPDMDISSRCYIATGNEFLVLGSSWF